MANFASKRRAASLVVCQILALGALVVAGAAAGAFLAYLALYDGCDDLSRCIPPKK